MGHRLNGWYTDAHGTGRHYRNGLRHREDGPAAIYQDGYREWYRHGQLHQEDGPAVIDPDGYRRWHRNGGLHREDGPVIIHPNGAREWWLNGEKVRMEDALDTPEKREAYFLEESLRRL